MAVPVAAAAILLIALIGRLNQTFGVGREFDVITAAVLGGTSLFGGAGTAFGAVVGSTLTTVVVFIPLGLLQGVVGQFFAALSLTLSSAVLLSLLYALLFIPVPAARPPRRS